MDSLDIKILKALQKNGRMPWNELAKTLKISSSSTAERVKKLEEAQIIQKYVAIVNSNAIGIDITAFVTINLEKPQHRDHFLKTIQALEEVQECHHMAGEADYLLKIKCQNMGKLEELVSLTIKEITGVVKTMTTLSMSTVKETSRLPIENPGFNPKQKF